MTMSKFWTPCPVFGYSMPNCWTPNMTQTAILLKYNRIMINLSSTGDSPHSVEGLLEAIFTKIKEKNSICLPPLVAMTVQI